MTAHARYEESVEWLEQLYRRPYLPSATVGLRRIHFLLDRLDNPHRAFRSVHVAGSAGKGSTTTMIGSVLRGAGFRTGLFRSPHLESYRERVAVDDQTVDEDDWNRCFTRVCAVAGRMEEGRYAGYKLGRPALFEVLFALAALHFRESGVEWAAIETGMGGRLDATNVLQSEVAVITTISLEHTAVLGDTVEEIAGEKAAIIKPGAAAVSGVRDPRAATVIEQRAAEQRVPLSRIDREYFVESHGQGLDGQALTVWDADGELDLELDMRGEYQAQNAAAAFAAARALQQRGVRIANGDIARGLKSARLPGRFELLGTRPDVLADGAHHPAAMAALRTSLLQEFPARRRVLLFAALSDKNVEAMVNQIRDSVDEVFTTCAPGTERAVPARTLARSFHLGPSRVTPIDDPAAALRAALSHTGRDDVLVIAGSLYLVGWARRQITAGVTA